jgi:sugar/nucleoside kinase (ribokinase family)
LFACQAARLGLRVGVLGRVGADDFGRLILRRLDECGVDIGHVLVDPALKTGLGVALCQGSDRAILTYPGSLNATVPEDVTDAFLKSARHLHHGSFFLQNRLLPALPQLFQRARELGLTTSLDTGWDPAEKWNSTLQATLSSTDIVMPNEQEALCISGTDSIDAAVGHLRTSGPSILFLKRGEQGAHLYSSSGLQVQTVPSAVGGDSVGAGDSADAGLLAGWLKGLPLGTCLQIACFCGWSVASAIGGLQGQPDWQAVSDRHERREFE